MAKKYQQQDDPPLYLQQPSAVYHRSEATAKAGDWDPNVPFTGTQAEWWEHFHAIERGEFSPITETHQRISQWLSEEKRK